MSASSAQKLLPHPAPAAADLRLVLYAVRRMAAGGIDDAHAASAFLMRFGLHYRRPLVLMRTLMAEMSRVAETRLTIAPCCCPRMSTSEQAILHALGTVGDRPEETHDRLASLLKVRTCATVLMSAQAVAACFADLGSPFAV